MNLLPRLPLTPTISQWEMGRGQGKPQTNIMFATEHFLSYIMACQNKKSYSQR